MWIDIFREKIRLFAPELKLIKDSNITYNKEECLKKINEYEELSGKLEKKIDKIKVNCIDFNYDTIQIDDIMKTKQCLINFEKSIDR